MGIVNIDETSDPSTEPTEGALGIFVNITTTMVLWAWANIELNYSETALPESMDKSSIRLYYWAISNIDTTGNESGEWKLCANQGADITRNLVWANVTHLTIFAPIGILPVNHPPELLEGKVSPASGDTNDIYTYTVIYKDIDGDMPAFVRVVIDTRSPELMAEVDINDRDVTNGKKYILTKVRLSASDTHTYRFEANDGIADAVVGTQTYQGPIVVAAPSPPSGAQPSDEGAILPGGEGGANLLYSLGVFLGIPILAIVLILVGVTAVVIFLYHRRIAQKRKLEVEAKEYKETRVKMCPGCGATQSPTATVCSRCGRDLTKRVLKRRQCPYCKAYNELTNIVCTACGNELVPSRRAIAPVTPPSPIPAPPRPSPPPEKKEEAKVKEEKKEEEELMKELEEFTWEDIE
jgi:ribosomal protein L40E